jgi:hypothetical protein
VAVELDEVADELYGTPPEDFIAVRKARQDEARDDGDKALATQIGALPKPSAAAWVCNLLVRAQREEIENLVELGDLLREAQESLAGDQLKALDVQRRQLVSALTRQARALAAERDHPVSTAVATQVEETLRAAMADPDAGQALLSGRLTSPMSYSGMGTTVSRPDLRLVQPPRTDRPAPAPAKERSAPRKEAAGGAAERRRREQEERQRAAQEKHRRELEAAQAAAEEASVTAEEAAEVLAERRRQVEELSERREQLQARVDELADQLADAERQVAEAASALKREERRRAGAEREAADAAESRDRAQALLDHLAGGTSG